MDVFQVLMANRFNIVSEENVRILNCIEVIFYNNRSVRNAYEEFLNITGNKDVSPEEMEERYLILLEEISKVVKMDKIHWKTLKRYYLPNGLLDKINA